MTSGFFRLKVKGSEDFYDTRIMEYADIDGYFDALDKSVINNSSFNMKLLSKARICVPVNNIEYLLFIPEEHLKEEELNVS